MQVGRDTVVGLKIQMYDAQGALLHAPEDAHTYLHGGHGGLPEALERSLEGRQPGETVRVQLEPEEAFGEYDAELVRVEEAERIYTVTDVAGGSVVMDANHPLAGMALRFSCEVVSVRAARPEEIERGVSLP